MCSIDLGEQNKLSCYLVHVEHFSESKMAAAAILDMANFHLLCLNDLVGYVKTVFRGFPVWGIHFWSYFLEKITLESHFYMI